MKKIVRIIMVMLTLTFSVGLMAQGTIKGTVTQENGKPAAGVTVLLKGTTTGTTSDANGSYSLQVPAGNNTLRISFIGFKPVEFTFKVANGTTVSKNFVLHEDLLSLDQVVVTGVQNKKTKLQSSVAITTISAKKIAEVAPRSAADLIKSIPGFYVESSGGKGNANVFARGLPSSGGLRYVQLQEDGMPVFEYGDLMFGNTDIFMRVDQNIARVEAVRGGSASILTSNAPGGIINFISKTGGETTKGSFLQTVGLTYMHSRTDFDIGGPASKNIRYHIGGFYRADDGIRSPGYTANNGGQIKANVTYLFKKGYFRLRGKYLNDRNIAYLPIPLQGSPAKGIPGFNPNYGTMKSLDLMRLHAVTPSGTEVNKNLADGMHPIVFSYGGEFFMDLGNNWSIKDNFQKSIIKEKFNSIFAVDGPFSASDYAAKRGLTKYHYAFADGYQAGQPINNMSTLNGNGLVGVYGWWAVDLPLEQFVNDYKLTKQFKNNTLTAGWYFSTNKVSSKWWWHNMLVDISDNTRKLNLVNDVTGQSLTTDGYTQYGSLFRDYYALTRINALYLNDEWDIGQLTINAGLRYDMGRTYGYTEKVANYTYDMNHDGVISPAETNVQYGTGQFIPVKYSYAVLSWSVGLNYEFNENSAVFARASKGHRAPADRSYAFGGTESTSNGFPASARVESIYQYEFGFKYNSSKIALFATGFYSYFNHIVFTDFVQEGGVLKAIQQFYNTSADGLELEAVAKFGKLNVSFTGTYQNMKYHNWVYHPASDPTKTIDFSGHVIQRLPKLYFTFRPSYQIGRLNASITWQYFGKRFTNPANKQVLPQFSQINARLDYAISQHFSVSASGNNLFNVIGLTEGNPRTGLTSVNSQYFYARPILGRSAVLSFQYNF